MGLNPTRGTKRGLTGSHLGTSSCRYERASGCPDRTTLGKMFYIWCCATRVRRNQR
ncbi:hypothetical protein BJX64DRAFT_265543 [Aspergillus heterothallicus]